MMDVSADASTISARATCWSITINNPSVEEYERGLPASWKLVGQLEKGAEGTLHYQGMLKTPQVRFSAVKKQFPRAHIEVARNQAALAKYVNKEDTRVAKVQSIPTLFEYQTMIAAKWDDEEFIRRGDARMELTGQMPVLVDVVMGYIDDLVADDIEQGMRGVEFIAINPMWRSSWMKFWRAIISRQKKFPVQNIQQDASDFQEALSGEEAVEACAFPA